MNRRITHAHALIGGATLCCLLVVPVALAGSAGGSGGPESAASSVNQQVKKLKKRVKKLEQQIDGLATQQGPPGQNATELFAYIRDDTSSETANVQYGSGVTAVSDPAGNSSYQVTFNRSLVDCVVQAGAGFGKPRAGGNAFPAAISFVNMGSAVDGEVTVEFLEDNTSSPVDSSFLITAFC